MRTMGLDLGEKTIGVAVSDLLGLTAQGLKVIKRQGQDELEELAQIIKDYEVSTIVIGLPKNMNNTLGPRAIISQEFAEVLKKRFPDLKIVLQDERLTTAEIQRQLISADISRNKRKKVVDKMAAMLILQTYLDKNKM
ncbi:putative holliday junction resolvase [Anaerobranca californiensis DSM 14826]|jgi:putative Holliday junction resolvase|uniref:Putative pre-16S rRNA nuclease n=1 Tax=Anaerobranca californiensis DSM 14826 TaxID=1120989 RepID=A0A1M6LDF0_9FIRM|nr:Holliday junction resolvase RuvX [Anaerobranca californiensis]SHJ69178.1 putative holliday junction resolvase [Anaerobranca californiensis DSM 14826]